MSPLHSVLLQVNLKSQVALLIRQFWARKWSILTQPSKPLSSAKSAEMQMNVASERRDNVAGSSQQHPTLIPNQ